MDRGDPYKAAVEQKIPQADIVFDKLYLVSNYLSKVVAPLRRSVKRAALGENTKLIKGQRHNLYRNPQNQPESQKRELEAFIDKYSKLNCVNILKEELRRLWDYIYDACARKHLNKWIGWARKADGIAPLQRMADSLKNSKDKILNVFKHRITNVIIEGFNNVISRTSHRAYGTVIRTMFS